MKEKKIKIGKYWINYVDQGKGQPMIFLHNGGGFWQSWVHQVTFFSKNYRTLALDWVGFGESSEAEEPISLELNYLTLKDFIDQLELEEIILIGNCIGASTALFYQKHHPEKVVEMVVMNICPGERIYPFRPIRTFFRTTSSNSFLRKWIDPLIRFAFLKTPVKKQFPFILFGPDIDPQLPLFKQYVEKFKQDRQTDGRLNLLHAVFSYTLTDFYKKPEKPARMLLLWGRK